MLGIFHKVLFALTLLLFALDASTAYAPPVIIAVAAAITTQVATGLVVGIVAKIAVAIVVSAIFALISSAMTKRPEPPNPDFSSFSQRSTNQTRQIQQPITSRSIVYGHVRISGPLVLIASTVDTKYLHMIVCLASHEIQGIPIVLVNSVPIYEDEIDVDGMVIAGDLKNKIRIKKHLGTASQTADSDLVSEVAEWSSDHRLRGIAYLYVRIEYDATIFSSVPNISAYVLGKKVTEIRDSAQPSIFTNNPVLILRDYATTAVTDLGIGFLTSEIDDDYAAASANTCDEFVAVNDVSEIAASVDIDADCVYFTLPDILLFQPGDRVNITSSISVPGGLGNSKYIVLFKPIRSANTLCGARFAETYEDAIAGTYIDITSTGAGTITVTKKAEPRYTCSGVADSARRPSDILREFLSAMGGSAFYVGGSWRFQAASYVTPTVTLDEDDIVDVVNLQTRHSRRDRFNAVKGIYVSPINMGVPVEYPSVESATYIAEDNGEEIFTDYDLPCTTRPHTAQRIAKIALERHRRMVTIESKFKLTALQTEVGDVIQLSLARFGYSSKTFEVTEWELTVKEEDSGAVPIVRMALRETDSNVFAWDPSEETDVDAGSNTGLQSPLYVGPPIGLAVSTDEASGVYSLVVNWNEVLDLYVYNNGTIEVQYRLSDDVVDLTDGTYQWIKTGDSALSEYYLATTDSVPGDPGITEPFKVLLNSVEGGPDVLGSLAQGNWAYGDNDSLGFDTIYVRMADDSDPDDSANTVQAKYFDNTDTLAGSTVEDIITPVTLGDRYDIRVRNVNYLGVKSIWVYINGYVIGDPAAGVTSTWDFRYVYEDVTDTRDWGDVLSLSTSDLEFGDNGTV